MYDFRTLSPLDFEELVRDLLQAELRIRMESFGSGRDLGIDFRFSLGGNKAVVQAKHYVESGINGLIRTARKENTKVGKLSPIRYILATSVSLTPSQKSRLQTAMPEAPLADEDVFGQKDLNNLLSRHPEVERKHFKLWLGSTHVLERILHSGIYNRSQTEMEIIRNSIPKFVQNDSVPAAESILAKSGALIIAGEPGVGKTTLARMLVWLHAEEGWQISVIDDSKEAFEIATDGAKRLIFFDDFLGQIRLSTDVIRGVDQKLSPLLHKVRLNKDVRFILTTRDYILRQAQTYSARLASPELNASEFTLHVGHYTRAARAKIVYNHLYFSALSHAERQSLLKDDFYLTMIDHRNFSPRLIDLLTNAEYLSMLKKPIRRAVETVLEHPQELWEKPYRTQISEEGRALMLALFFNSATVALPALQDSFNRIVDAMGFTIPTADRATRFRTALKELEGSVLSIQNRKAQFSNPGVRDFLLTAVKEDGLLPAVVGVATEYQELRQSWNLFCSLEPDQPIGAAMREKWIRAAKRLNDADTGTALERLQLVLDMYDRIGGEELVVDVQFVAGDLEANGIEGDEVELSQSVLEQLAGSALPQNALEEVRVIMIEAVGNMLSETGGHMMLEEIEATANSMKQCGADEDSVSEAVGGALRAFVKETDWSDVWTFDELDDLEGELRSVMNEFGVEDRRVEGALERKRDDLSEQGERHRSGGYGRRSMPSLQSETTDDEIRSMFDGLRQS